MYCMCCISLRIVCVVLRFIAALRCAAVCTNFNALYCIASFHSIVLAIRTQCVVLHRFVSLIVLLPMYCIPLHSIVYHIRRAAFYRSVTLRCDLHEFQCVVLHRIFSLYCFSYQNSTRRIASLRFTHCVASYVLHVLHFIAHRMRCTSFYRYVALRCALHSVLLCDVLHHLVLCFARTALRWFMFCAAFLFCTEMCISLDVVALRCILSYDVCCVALVIALRCVLCFVVLCCAGLGNVLR
jgi:hypothetical protein